MLNPNKNRTFKHRSVSSKENEKDADSNEAKKMDFISKWKRNSERSVKVKGVMSARTLIIVLVLLLICMYLLDKKYM
ncbi:hypothetical protein [Mariniflexile sp.]|uniref:hypothetical protein n=1 Tax=Mariniflexile sp. TaxID=1979402 RepID=UPI004047ACE2